MCDFMDVAQTGFIKNISMLENVFLVQELIREYGYKSTAPQCMFKVDIKNAFDSLYWSLLRSVFVGLDFPDRFVNCVIECVSYPIYYVVVNSNSYRHFHGKRRLRQGDHLSPFLFVIGMEYMSLSSSTIVYEMPSSIDYSYIFC